MTRIAMPKTGKKRAASSKGTIRYVKRWMVVPGKGFMKAEAKNMPYWGPPKKKAKKTVKVWSSLRSPASQEPFHQHMWFYPARCELEGCRRVNNLTTCDSEY